MANILSDNSKFLVLEAGEDSVLEILEKHNVTCQELEARKTEINLYERTFDLEES